MEVNVNTTTNTRRLDVWVGPFLDLLKKECPGLTANRITYIRLAILPLFALCLVYRPELAVIMAVFDGWTDILDGAWARRFGETGDPWGKFVDQASDKISNWFRIWLIWKMSAANIHLSVDLGGWSFFWILLFASGLLFDGNNLLVRTWYYFLKKDTEGGSPVPWGKIKVWFQAYGITLFVIMYARAESDAGPGNGFPFWLVYALTWVLALLMVAPQIGYRWGEDWQCWAMATGVTLLMAMGISAGTAFVLQYVAELALYGSVVLALASTVGQVRLRYEAYIRKRNAQGMFAHTWEGATRGDAEE